MGTFIKHIEKILKTDDRLWSKDDDKKLLKNKLVELVSNDDEKLLGSLLDDSEVKKHFFKKIKDLNIFLKDRFLQFITMNEFLPDSFTAFENEIGLSDNNKLITQKDEISLIFPHKDCILEGGQTKEEARRDEIFYNTILASDEIDRIKEPKVLVNWKKFDKDGKHEVKEITKQDNLIIKGNNLLALYSLLPKYRGEIKLIYIDPPYNTDTDSFLYNDRFNHSAWLTFMKNRLEVARELLADDGVIFVQCDDNEQAYLKVLMDNIFDSDNFINCIAVKMSEATGVKMTHSSKRLPKLKEYLLVYKNNLINFDVSNILVPIEEMGVNYKYVVCGLNSDEIEGLRTMMNEGAFKEEDIKRFDSVAKKIILKTFEQVEPSWNKFSDDEKKQWKESNAYRIVREVSSSSAKKIADKKRKYCNHNFFGIKTQNNKLYLIKNHYNQSTPDPNIKLIFAIDYLFVNPCDFWSDIKTTRVDTEGDIDLKNGKKPERLLRRIIEMATKPQDLVLDFFAGAGTTGAVAHKMGRRYILVEQMDYIHDLPESRLVNVINGDQTGISKDVNWKGGGSFVYAELLEWNQKYVNQLEKAKTEKEVFDIYKKIEKEQFYKYKYEPKKFDLKSFKELDLKEQKKALLDILDMNHLFVNRSSMDDTTFKVDEKDKKLTRAFYEEK